MIESFLSMPIAANRVVAYLGSPVTPSAADVRRGGYR